MDQEQLHFHIASNDFFGTLATILDLASQDLKTGRAKPKDVAELLAKQCASLIYLQQHYHIEESDSTCDG